MILTCKLRLGCQVAAEPDPGFTEPEPQVRAGRSALPVYRDSAASAASAAVTTGAQRRRPARGQWPLGGDTVTGTPTRASVTATGALPDHSGLLYTLPKVGHLGGAEIAVAQQRGPVAFGPGQTRSGTKTLPHSLRRCKRRASPTAKGRRRQLNAPGRSPCASTHRRAPPAPPRRARP
jgi:hypothetical protein